MTTVDEIRAAIQAGIDKGMDARLFDSLPQRPVYAQQPMLDSRLLYDRPCGFELKPPACRLFGMDVYESPMLQPRSVPVREHKGKCHTAYSRRIQKKWNKRFGFKEVDDIYVIGGNIIAMSRQRLNAMRVELDRTFLYGTDLSGRTPTGIFVDDPT